jgi:DNA polymerase-3 subunit alpha
LVKKVEELKVIFKDGLFLEVQLFNKDLIPAQAVLTDLMRDVAESTKTNLVATAAPFYCKREDAYDQRVLLCSSLQTTFPQVENLLNQGDDSAIGPFFKSDRYFLPSYEEMLSFGHTENELRVSNEVATLTESYDVLNKPLLPEFPCPNGMSPDEYLKELCRGGWRQKIAGKIPKASETTYADRVKYELGVLQHAGLSSYFLILNDICNFISQNGWLLPIGRGSAAGCLTSYLIDVTQVDPVKYDLIFERFYNAGRNTKDRVSMPDIDLDVPSSERGKIIDYIKMKYGESKVGYICNFQTMKGRGAMKEVLRAYGNVPFEMMNRITENIPDEASIIDDLQVMKEEGEEPSIILWALKNEQEKLSEWARKTR